MCERCGVLQVNETDEPAALEALDPEAAAVEQHDGTALEPIA